MDVASRVCRLSLLKRISPRTLAAASRPIPYTSLRFNCCPLSAETAPAQTSSPGPPSPAEPGQISFQSASLTPTRGEYVGGYHRDAAKLPISCPGCGALTQDIAPGEAGFYTRTRNTVKKYLKAVQQESRQAGGDGGLVEEGAVEEETVEKQPVSMSEDGGQIERKLSIPNTTIPPPVCDRCHYLIHDSRGVPIAHPSIEDIADSIAESPFSKNHVYHVIDAADFPMSLIPSIYKSLSLAKPRSQNRRSQHSFSSKPSLSFIITRSDLLAPTKDMVDRMMPKLSSILRAALGRRNQKIRLGNVHLVSSKRGWWTKDIKENIWKRGGGNWLVGKFNVGKSSLFEVLFPKGSGERTLVYEELQQQQETESVHDPTPSDFLREGGLLPPPQPEVPFPTMPLVSSLPGTTASPIRVPFGNNRGELIDLPGLERGGLDRFVRPEDRLDLVMERRPTVTQYKIRPGQSLLLGGGLVRITPDLDENDPSATMLAYPFVPLKAHVTSTEKAIDTQEQHRESGVDSILADNARDAMASAGKYLLQTDVTKSRAGSVIRAGVDTAKLPFKVYATDILIEGVGWIELVCQVRKNRRTLPATSLQAEHDAERDSTTSTVPKADSVSIETSGFVPFSTTPTVTDAEDLDSPRVEVFTPLGKFIGQRPCLDVWETWNNGKAQKQMRTARPRKPMSGAKKHASKLHQAVPE